MFCLFVQGILFFGLTLLIQSKFWRLSCGKASVDAEKELMNDDEEDEDVQRERLRVLKSEIGTDVLQVKNLFKRYCINDF